MTAITFFMLIVTLRIKLGNYSKGKPVRLIFDKQEKHLIQDRLPA